MMEVARVGQVCKKIEGRFSPRRWIEERFRRQSGLLRVAAPRESETGGGGRREELTALTKTFRARKRGTCGLPQRMHGPLQVEAEAYPGPWLSAECGRRQAGIYFGPALLSWSLTFRVLQEGCAPLPGDPRRFVMDAGSSSHRRVGGQFKFIRVFMFSFLWLRGRSSIRAISSCISPYKQLRFACHGFLN